MTNHDLFPLAETNNLQHMATMLPDIGELFLAATDAEDLGNLVGTTLELFEKSGVPREVAVAAVAVVLGCLGFEPPD